MCSHLLNRVRISSIDPGVRDCSRLNDKFIYNMAIVSLLADNLYSDN